MTFDIDLSCKCSSSSRLRDLTEEFFERNLSKDMQKLARQLETKQDNSRQSKTTRDKARQLETKQDNSRQSKTTRDKARQLETKNDNSR
jgi:hypothetical protein